MGRRALALTAACVALLATPVLAQEDEPGEEPPEYARSGAYLLVTGIYAIGVFGESFTNSLGFKAHGGYRFHPRFALEGQFERLTGFDSARGRNGTGWTLTANAKGFLLTGRYQPFLYLGAGGSRIAGLGEGAARFGGGIDLYGSACEPRGICYALSLDASYVLPTGANAEFDYVSLGWGFQARF